MGEGYMPKHDNEPTVDDLLSAAGDEESLLDAIKGENEEFEAGIDPNHPILTVEEQRAAAAQAREDIEKERRKAALKTFLEKEKQRLRTEEGLTSGDAVKDEIVEIMLDLPEFADRLTINGQAFFHGHSYKLPRHMADSMREQQSRMWDHDREIKGQSIKDRISNEAVRGMRPAAVLAGAKAA